MTLTDPDTWTRSLRYRSAYAVADDAARRIRGRNGDQAKLDAQMEGIRRELLAGIVDEDERDGIDDGLAGLRPRY